ncbi:hypothetical protein [Cytobacillus sp. IB215665]|uniref:hypothetical protein n=1 Tax=Cytobacillus sp. IB215665 TaxID=3097357 RepID=UPI002A12C22A|nr:hypothetical protein [Cytobacillus sp. IB215665]MDX8367893.1 hypothetical protein [Cytobacillus sp. IB215665]
MENETRLDEIMSVAVNSAKDQGVGVTDKVHLNLDDFMFLHGLAEKAEETTVKVKFQKELEVVIQDDEIDEEDRLTSFTILECMGCHWIFNGDCERFGYGFTSQSTQIPNYCPMCGSKLEGEIEETEA